MTEPSALPGYQFLADKLKTLEPGDLDTNWEPGDDVDRDALMHQLLFEIAEASSVISRFRDHLEVLNDADVINTVDNVNDADLTSQFNKEFEEWTMSYGLAEAEELCAQDLAGFSDRARQILENT